MNNIREVIEIAAAQHGVVTVEQARRAGLPKSTFFDVVHREGWRRVSHGVYAAPASADSRQAAQAALLATGANSVLCRRSAAHLLRLLPEPAAVELFLPESERTTGRPGVLAYRTRTLRPLDITEIDGLRTTTGPRTVIDLAAVLDQHQLRAVLIDGQQRRVLTLNRVERRLAGIGPVRGVGVLRRLLWELHPEHCDSVLEARVRALLRGAGIDPPHPRPYPIDVGGRTLHVDIAWPDRRIGVEVDGFSYHSDRTALDRDHRRINQLTLAGWQILRVGWGRLDTDPLGFVAELRALMR